MRPDREHPLYHLDAETLLVATYIWVDDALKALQAQGIRFPKPQRHQKATLPELLTIALFLTFIGLDLSKGYLLAQSLLRPYFPSLPHLSRFLRVLQNAQSLLAHLALRLAQGPSLLHVVDSKIRATPVTKPLPMAHGHRIRGLRPAWFRGWGRPSGGLCGLRSGGGHQRPGAVSPLGPSARECPGGLGQGTPGGLGACSRGPGLSLG
ncbi:hypothetical protein [Thermus caliditerrae]|uniref:hypothetical protein n=1 Tax=Thermus caliditerrae TaxID=1330700 RepID=UPI000A4885B9|nr:hypothetical protein [Thermus caliditerrae]